MTEQTDVLLPEPAATVVERYLARLLPGLPGLLDGFYVVGSLALGEFRAGRSDIDFVATLARPLAPEALATLRRVHRRCYAEGVVHAVMSRSWPLVCNGVFLLREDLARPPAIVTAAAQQVAEKFTVGNGFDVNPVTWWTLAHRGIALHGPAPAHIEIHLDDAELRTWTAANLVSYWRPWAQAISGRGSAAWVKRVRALNTRRLMASGVLSPARMHATIMTGEVMSKERAGAYALYTFARAWHPLIHEALTYWRGLPSHTHRPAQVVRTETAAFVLHVIDRVGAVL